MRNRAIFCLSHSQVPYLLNYWIQNRIRIRIRNENFGFGKKGSDSDPQHCRECVLF
jgi:hypothetical protein